MMHTSDTPRPARAASSRIVLAALFSCALAMPAAAQITFNLLGTDASGYPLVKVSFDAKDRNGVHIGNFVPSDFTVVEDGIVRPVQSVSCPPPITPPLSLTLLIDVSYSMGLAGRMNNARVAASTLVRSLSYPPAATGIISFDDTTRITLPYTSDTTTILSSIGSLSAMAGGGTDVVGGFLDKITGAIEFTKNQPGDKYVVILTDGAPFLLTSEEKKIIDAATAAGVRIHSVTLSANTQNFPLRRITAGTNGLWFESITTEQAAIDAFKTIGDRIFTYPPCELVYLTDGCETLRNVDITLRKNASTVTKSAVVNVPPASIVWLDASTMFVDFGALPTGTTRTADVTLTARNGTVTVQTLTSVFGPFTVINTGGAVPFTLAPGQSRTIRIQFLAPNANRVSNVLPLTTTAPCVQRVVCAGGVHSDSLRLVQPNGGEVLYAGSSYQFRWAGIPASEEVRLEYSTDAGSTWLMIASNASSLFANWTVANTPSTTCLGIVYTLQKRNAPADATWLPWQPSEIVDLAFSPSGTMLAATLADGRIKVYYPLTGALVDILAGHGARAHALAFSPDSKLLVTTGHDGRVKVWDAATGAPLRDLAGGSQIHSAVFSSDGASLATADQSAVTLWKTSDWTQAWTRAGNTMADGALAIAQGNAWIASASGSNVMILSTVNGAPLQTLSGHGGAVRCLSASPDKGWLASGSDDRTIRLWDTRLWTTRATLSGHSNAVTSVSLTGSGLYMVSGSRDRSVKVWDVRNAMAVQTFTGHTGDVNAARFERRTGLIASAGPDRTIRMWGYKVPLSDASDSLWSIITPTTTLKAEPPVFETLLCAGETSESTVFFKNDGNQPITLTGASFVGSAFEFVPGTSIPPSRTLGPGDTLRLPVRFAATTAGGHSGTLHVTTDATGLPFLDIPLAGHKDSALVTFAPDTIDVGEVYPCTLPLLTPLELMNVGTVDGRLDSTASVPDGLVDFGGNLSKNMLAGAVDTVWVSVNTKTFGAFASTVELTSRPCDIAQTLLVKGSLVDPTPVLRPASVVFGFTTVGDTSYQTVVIRNPTKVDMTLDSITISGTTFAIADLVTVPMTIPASDSVSVRLLFAPVADGTWTGRFSVHASAPCDASAGVPLSGSSARKPAIEVLGGEFRTLLCPDESFADSIIVLKNTGGEPLVISGMTVGGTHQGDFTVLTATALTIAPGNSDTVRLRFSPKGTGFRSGTLTIANNSAQQPSLVLSLSARKDSAGMEILPASIDAGTTWHCSYPVQRSLGVVNTGTVPLDVAARASTLPAFVSLSRMTVTLQPGDTVYIDVAFHPPAFGTHSGAIDFTGAPCTLAQSVPVRVVYEPSDPRSNVVSIDFGTVGVGSTANGSARISNPSSAPMRIASITVLPAPAFVTRIAPAALPAVIAPGGSLDISYGYAPLASDTVASRIVLVTDQPCVDTVVVELRGLSRAAFSTLTLADLTAEIGTRIRIPVILTASANLALTGTRSFTADVVFNRSMLWPERVFSSSGQPVMAQKAEGDSLVVTVTVDQPVSPSNGIQAEVECLVLLGNNDVTPLTFRTFTWTNGTASASTQSGSFTATGICTAGGKRLMSLPSGSVTLRNAPNPFNPSTEIIFTLPEAATVDLRVYDALGREVGAPRDWRPGEGFAHGALQCRRTSLRKLPRRTARRRPDGIAADASFEINDFGLRISDFGFEECDTLRSDAPLLRNRTSGTLVPTLHPPLHRRDAQHPCMLAGR
ncbi:MAG: choice-of-anchor D domain-containing protein [Ignavibacteria bacterium]|nr:choice-of-anchor D domain-containing protein [Ignavibacteria bacterium]